MGFHFSLATLLRFRHSLEKQYADKLQAASLTLTRAQETLSRMDQAMADSARADEASLQVGRSAAELQFAVTALSVMQARRKELEIEVQRLEVVRQAAAIEYQRAYRQREVLETLAAQQRHIYQQEQLQHEQRGLDDSYLLQLWRKRLG